MLNATPAGLAEQAAGGGGKKPPKNPPKQQKKTEAARTAQASRRKVEKKGPVVGKKNSRPTVGAAGESAATSEARSSDTRQEISQHRENLTFG